MRYADKLTFYSTPTAASRKRGGVIDLADDQFSFLDPEKYLGSCVNLMPCTGISMLAWFGDCSPITPRKPADRE